MTDESDWDFGPDTRKLYLVTLRNISTGAEPTFKVLAYGLNQAMDDCLNARVKPDDYALLSAKEITE